MVSELGKLTPLVEEQSISLQTISLPMLPELRLTLATPTNGKPCVADIR